MLRVLAQLPLLIASPVICRARGHHWHVWIRANTAMRVCDRCGFHVTDPRST